MAAHVARSGLLAPAVATSLLIYMVSHVARDGSLEIGIALARSLGSSSGLAARGDRRLPRAVVALRICLVIGVSVPRSPRAAGVVAALLATGIG